MLLIVGPPTWLAAAMFAVALCRAASHGDRTSAERARLASILNSLGSAPSLPGPSRKTPRQPRSLVRCGRGDISPDVPAPLTTSAPCRRLLVRLRTGGRAPAACRADRDGARAMENIAIVKEVFAAVATRDDVRLAALCSGALVVEDAVSGVVGDGDRYEGRGALVRYLIASEASWNRRELRPRTFHSLGAGRVMVAGGARRTRRGHERGRRGLAVEGPRWRRRRPAASANRYGRRDPVPGARREDARGREMNMMARRARAQRLHLAPATSDAAESEQELVKAELVRSRDFLQQTLDSLRASLAVLDEAGEIIATNLAWRQFHTTTAATRRGAARTISRHATSRSATSWPRGRQPESARSSLVQALSSARISLPRRLRGTMVRDARHAVPGRRRREARDQSHRGHAAPSCAGADHDPCGAARRDRRRGRRDRPGRPNHPLESRSGAPLRLVSR